MLTDPQRRDARIGWITGGSLLLLAGGIGVAGAVTLVPGWLAVVRDGAWIAGILIFALGWRYQGSVVARYPLGMTALIITALLPVIDAVIAVLAAGDTGLLTVLALIAALLRVAALLVAGIEIARQAIIPDGVRWVPLILIVVVLVANALAQTLAFTGAVTDQAGLIALFTSVGLLSNLVLACLGVLAIIFALRLEDPEPVRNLWLPPEG